MSETSSFKLIIEDDEGRRSVVPIDLGSVREGISIGRQEGNTIRLNERNVSRRHARFIREPVGIYAEDLDSYNGVWVNGDRIKGRQELHDGDTVRVGDFQLELRGEGLQRRVEETTQRTIVNEGSEVTRPDIRLESAMNGGPLSPPMGIPHLGGGVPLGMQSGGLSNGASRAEIHGQSRVDFPRNPTIDDELRPEPTALIRMDHVEAIESARKRDTQILAGQKAKIVCVSTQFAGGEYDIDKTEVVIGRTEENDIPIDHRSVSRHHAKIVVNQRSYRIMDLKSANGTLVNGEEYAQTELKRGDLIELGHVKFRFIPPGGSYEFTPEEVGAMRAAKGMPQPSAGSGVFTKGTSAPITIDGDVQVGSAPTVINQWSEELEQINGKKKLKPVIVAGLSAFVVICIGGVVFWGVTHDTNATSNGTNNEVKVVRPNDDDHPSGRPDELLQRAKTAMAQREWTEARKLAQAVVVMEPENAQAIEIQKRSTDEIIGQSALDRAVRGIEQRNWDEAYRALAEVPESTSAYAQAQSLRGQARAGRLMAKVDEARRRISEGNVNEGRRLIGDIVDMDASSPELPSLRSALEDAERNGAHLAVADSSKDMRETNKVSRPPPTKAPAQPQQTKAQPTPTPQPTPPPTPKPAPPAANSALAVDSKTYYAEGLKALQAQDTDKAIELLDKCVKADTKAGMCYRALGISYARLKNGPKAAKYYRMYLRVMPDAKDAKQVEELLKAYEGAAPP